MSVTLKDVAKQAGVSAVTVSKVVNGNDQHISQETRAKIQKIVKQMGYVPNAVAKGLKVKRTNMLGFLLPDISNSFFPDVARGIEDTAKRYGFGVVMCNTDDDAQQETEQIRFLTSRMVDGIVFVRALKRSNMDQLFDSGLPVVIVDREIEIKNNGVGQIFVDTRRGIHESTKLLIDRGCRKIAFISANYSAKYDRYQGYCSALEEAGIALDPLRVYQDHYDVKTGYEGMQVILGRSQIDGVVCGNDMIAVGVLNALKERKIEIPQQVKVIGFDDIYLSRYLSPPLTTVYQPAYQMGASAAKMLIDHILYGNPLYKKSLDFELRIRESV